MSPDVRLQRWFDAPPDTVFDAYTDPDAQRALRAGELDWVVESKCDLRVGGEWIIRFGPASAPYVERNVFHTVERPHRLVYSSTTEWPDGSHVESLVEISMRWIDGRTLLTLTQEGLPSGDTERAYIDGWNEFLDGFVARIEQGSDLSKRREEVMGKVTCEISMSLDGFIAGPNVRIGNGMGDDGDRLHDWMFDAKTETDAAIVDEKYASTGAIVIGKRMFDVGFEPWGDPPPFGKPVFIVTHATREPLPMQGGTTYTFVTDGIEDALEVARAAAGDKDVGIWGGANIIDEYLNAGLVDEMQVHIVPVLFGEGTRLFEALGPRRIELKRTSTVDSPGATHLRFEVVR